MEKALKFAEKQFASAWKRMPQGSYARLDPDGLERKLSVVDEGRRRGQNGVPIPSSPQLDDFEQKILYAVVTHRDAQWASHREAVKGLLERYAKTGSAEARKSMDEADAQTVQLEAETHRARSELGALGLEERKAREALDAYQRERNLVGPPRAEAPWTTIWAVILTVALGELFLNAALLQADDTTGWMGGVTKALVLAISNVVLGALLAGLLRLLWHRNILKRLLGLIGSAVITAGALALNILAAHLRELLSLGTPPSVVDAMAQFQRAPLAIALIDSWGLLMVGLLSFGVSAYKFFTRTDPHPGYNRIWNEWDDRKAILHLR